MEVSADVAAMVDGSARPKESSFHADADQGTGRIGGASCREPGKEIRSGGDRDGHRIEMSLLPLKKRALNDYSSSGTHGNLDDSSSSPRKMRRIDDCIRAKTKVDVERSEAPIPRHQDSVPAAAEGDAVVFDDEKLHLIKGKWKATAEASPVDQTAAELDAMAEAEKLRLIKGQWKATAEASPVEIDQTAAEVDAMAEEAEKLRLIKGKWKAAPEDQPPVKKQKLMHDGIRSSAQFNERLLYNSQDQETPLPLLPRDVAAPAHGEPMLGGEVRARLAEMGATRPRFVLHKRLEKSDVCTNQNRLLVSCKRESMEGCPITWYLTPEELRRVEDKHVGLYVAALDRDGERWHRLTCKFLDSNSGYRLISGWGDFLRWNGLLLDSRGMWTRDVDIELWAFRSRELRKQPPIGPGGKVTLKKDNDGKQIPVGEVEEHFHRDGSLGLLLLHRENCRRRVNSDEDDDGDKPRLPVARRPQKKGTTNQRDHKRDASASPARGEVARAGGGRKVQGEAGDGATMSKVEMVAKFGELMSDAVIGMLGLRDAMLRERQQNVEVGCAT